jgi:hypothetical protein
MTLEFKSYNSIENVNEKYLAKIKQYYNEDDEWIVMEKIHGANFSALTDGKNVLWCRRTGKNLS